MKVAILMAITAAFSILAYRTVGAYLTYRAIDVTRIENSALRSRHAALRNEAFALGEQAQVEIGRGYQLARSTGRPTRSHPRIMPAPSRSAGDLSIIDWLSVQGAQLESLAHDLSAAPPELPAKQAAASPAVPSAEATGSYEVLPAVHTRVKVAERRPPTPHRSARSVAH